MSFILNNKKITILLATYNGASFLEDQLTSFANQSLDNIDILMSDDGSSDNTCELLNTWAKNGIKGIFK